MFVSVQLKCMWRALLQLSLKRLLAAWFFCVNQTTLYCWAGRISVEKLQLPDSYVLSKDMCVIIPLLHSQIADTFSALEPTPAWRLSTSRREWWSPLWKLKRSRGFPSNPELCISLVSLCLCSKHLAACLCVQVFLLGWKLGAVWWPVWWPPPVGPSYQHSYQEDPCTLR